MASIKYFAKKFDNRSPISRDLKLIININITFFICFFYFLRWAHFSELWQWSGFPPQPQNEQGFGASRKEADVKMCAFNKPPSGYFLETSFFICRFSLFFFSPPLLSNLKTDWNASIAIFASKREHVPLFCIFNIDGAGGRWRQIIASVISQEDVRCLLQGVRRCFRCWNKTFNYPKFQGLLHAQKKWRS